MNVQVGDKVKMLTKKGFELPTVITVKENDVILKRRKKKGTLTISMTKFYELNKSFRGAKYECIVSANI
jgi:hypothetical protein